MQVELIANPHQTRKWVTPLVLFGFKTPTTLSPHKTKNKNIKPLSLDRSHKDMTTMSQGNKKITRKIPATNNKYWFLPVVCAFLKKYRQPIINLWSVPVALRETVRWKNWVNIFASFYEIFSIVFLSKIASLVLNTKSLSKYLRNNVVLYITFHKTLLFS